MPADESNAEPLSPVPVPVEGAREASLTLLEKRLPPEQAEILKAQRKAKADKPVKEAKPTPKAEPAPEPKAEPLKEVIDFGQEAEATPTAESTAEPEAEPEELNEAELAKLDEKARHRYLTAHKEAAKVRKRAQEAEAALREREEKLSAYEKEQAALKQELAELQTRGVALSGNQFVQFKDGDQVAAWGSNAQEALALLAAHAKAVKAGRADAEDEVTHELPNGVEVALKLSDQAAYEARLRDAHHWFAMDKQVASNREAASKIEQRHSKTAGYAEAYQAYAKDAALSARLPELMAKAALYDTLMSRKAVIEFPDTVGATKTASSGPAARTLEQAAPEKRKTAPLTDTSTSAPRMVSSMEGDDSATRKSQLMEMARTADSYEAQQKYLKQAAMIPSPNRTTAGRKERGAA
jgi:hypothetical protein